MLETEDNHMEKLESWKFNRIAIGNVLEENLFEHWLKEQLTGFNRHVKYIHTKYMLVDPLSNDPIIITGSGNFSNASIRNNDENMLVIRGILVWLTSISQNSCDFSCIFTSELLQTQ